MPSVYDGECKLTLLNFLVILLLHRIWRKSKKKCPNALPNDGGWCLRNRCSGSTSSLGLVLYWAVQKIWATCQDKQLQMERGYHYGKHEICIVNCFEQRNLWIGEYTTALMGEIALRTIYEAYSMNACLNEDLGSNEKEKLIFRSQQDSKKSDRARRDVLSRGKKSTGWNIYKAHEAQYPRHRSWIASAHDLFNFSPAALLTISSLNSIH